MPVNVVIYYYEVYNEGLVYCTSRIDYAIDALR